MIVPRRHRVLGRILGSVMALALLSHSGSAAVAAKYAAIVIDVGSGEVLFARSADAPRYPASLTKMMTLYLAFDAIKRGEVDLATKIVVSKRAASAPSSKLGLRRGERIKVKDVIMTLITKSANDAAIALAEALGGSEPAFAQRMTAMARRLGMRNTTFRNASGLPNRQQHSTARDMSILAQALIRDFPGRYRYFSTRSYEYKGQTYRSHNRLLGTYEGTDGIKTGYINASGFNVVASVERNGRRVIAVVLGGKSARSRDAHARVLLDSAFTRLAAPRPGVRPTPDQVAGIEAGGGTPREIDSAVDETASIEAMAPGSEGPRVDEDWGVQVGAFSTIERAQTHLRTVSRTAPDLLAGARIAIVAAPRALFRARLIGLSEDEARQACRALRAHAMDCLAVPPPAPLGQGDR